MENKYQLVRELDDSDYRVHFDILNKLGSGTFGTVYKVKHKLHETKAALKIIEHQVNTDTEIMRREMDNLIKVNSEYVIRYLYCWVEMDNKCNKMPAFGRRSADEAMNLSEFIISCELFKELLECIQYLHDLSPAVIHRDLKPDNILISLNPQNGRYLKLCDFGLAVLHEASGVIRHTGCVGTSIYMATEVRLNKDYTTKVDVYSLAVIASQLFCLNAFE
ncbi:unnamed protein product [Medioppia subpectinata]|uniref:non-specific serine/threonine protein kinase n=1 Tax=Medioppia subpectinata TaxID=1979941 RepID=A0A7R9PTG2_9ACAR|nr:unnamed protein product [Medioppia subpectinata]CAG2100100.1 unnamed protein product [Medioppia subpectinata]